MDRTGYAQLVRWTGELGEQVEFGVEGSGSYGAGVVSQLRRHGHLVLQVNRSDRGVRHLRGKNDTIDAEAAARAVLVGVARAGGAEDPRRCRGPPRCPALTSLFGVGGGCAAELLLVVGDNPERIRSEAALAKLCGACPIPASSARLHRHRLNRGGHRQANAALHRILVVRIRFTKPSSLMQSGVLAGLRARA